MSEYVSAALLWNAGAAILVLPIYAGISFAYMSANAADIGLNGTQATALTLVGTIMLSSIFINPFSSALDASGLLPINRRNQGIGVLVRAVGSIFACLFIQDIVWVACAEMAGVVLPPVLAMFELSFRRMLRLRWGRKIFSTLLFMLSYSLRSFGVSAVAALILQAGTMIVGVALGPGNVTYFNAAFRIYIGVRQVLSWITAPFQSVLSRLFVKDAGLAQQVIIGLVFLSLGGAALVSGALALAAPHLIRIWLGNAVPVAAIAETLVVLVLGFIINAPQIPLIAAGDSIGRPGAFFANQFAWLIMFLSIAISLVNILGIVGVALGLSISVVIVSPWYLLKAGKVLRIEVRDLLFKGIVPVSYFVVPALITAAAAAVLQSLSGYSPFSILTGCVFLASGLLMAALIRRALPTSETIGLLKVAL